MLQRFLAQRPAVLAALLDEKLRKSKSVSGMSDHEVQCCEDFVAVMEVMLTATMILCEEKTPTSGLILPLLEKLSYHFERKDGDSDFVLTLKNAVGQSLATRYTDVNLRMFLEESSALDPRTKGKTCIQEETWERLVNKLSVMDFIKLHSIKKETDEIAQRPTDVQTVNPLPPNLPTLPVMSDDHGTSESGTDAPDKPTDDQVKVLVILAVKFLQYKSIL
jgi:hypothetical protein